MQDKNKDPQLKPQPNFLYRKNSDTETQTQEIELKPVNTKQDNKKPEIEEIKRLSKAIDKLLMEQQKIKLKLQELEQLDQKTGEKETETEETAEEQETTEEESDTQDYLKCPLCGEDIYYRSLSRHLEGIHDINIPKMFKTADGKYRAGDLEADNYKRLRVKVQRTDPDNYITDYIKERVQQAKENGNVHDLKKDTAETSEEKTEKEDAHDHLENLKGERKRKLEEVDIDTVELGERIDKKMNKVRKTLKETGEAYTTRELASKLFDKDKIEINDKAYDSTYQAIVRLRDKGFLNEEKHEDYHHHSKLYSINEGKEKKVEEQHEKSPEQDLDKVLQDNGVSQKDFKMAKHAIQKIVVKELPEDKEAFVSFYGGKSISGFNDYYSGDDTKARDMWQKLYSNKELLEAIREKAVPTKNFRWEHKGNSGDPLSNWVIMVE